MENEKWSYQVSQVSGSESGRRFYVFSDKNELITDKVKTEGQARLIAAAPDLLRALNQALAYINNPQMFDLEELTRGWWALKARVEGK